MFRNQFAGAIALAGLGIAAGDGLAQEFPKLTVEAELSLQSEKTIGSQSAKKIHDTFAEI
jgi:hypothetical protein